MLLSYSLISYGSKTKLFTPSDIKLRCKNHCGHRDKHSISMFCFSFLPDLHVYLPSRSFTLIRGTVSSVTFAVYSHLSPLITVLSRLFSGWSQLHLFIGGALSVFLLVVLGVTSPHVQLGCGGGGEREQRPGLLSLQHMLLHWGWTHLRGRSCSPLSPGVGSACWRPAST